MASHRNIFPLLRLPRELRDMIYEYAALADETWIGSATGHRNSDGVPAAVKSQHSLVRVSHQVSDEYRLVVWRRMLLCPDRVDFRIRNFEQKWYRDFVFCCSRDELKKLDRTGKCQFLFEVDDSPLAPRDIEFWVDAMCLFRYKATLVMENGSVQEYLDVLTDMNRATIAVKGRLGAPGLVNAIRQMIA